jgi:hypothetical protein
MLSEPTPFPERLSDLNDEELRAVGTSDLGELAELLRADTSGLLDLLGDGGDRPVPFFGMQHTAAGVAGVLSGELLVHGLDLARARGRDWTVRREQASVVVAGLLPSLRHSFDRDVARRAAGTYHLQASQVRRPATPAKVLGLRQLVLGLAVVAVAAAGVAAG